MCLGNLFKVEWDFCGWLHFVLFISDTVKLCIIINMSKGLFIQHLEYRIQLCLYAEMLKWDRT